MNKSQTLFVCGLTVLAALVAVVVYCLAIVTFSNPTVETVADWLVAR
jgi:hypothetical protein